MFLAQAGANLSGRGLPPRAGAEEVGVAFERGQVGFRASGFGHGFLGFGLRD